MKAWSATGTWDSESGWKHPYYGANGKLRSNDYYTSSRTGGLCKYEQKLWKHPVTGDLVDRATWERAEYLRQMGVER